MAKTVDISALKPADLALAFKRSNAIPMDSTSLFDSLASAQAYASSGAVSYAGQVISVVEGGVVTIYKINSDGTLSALGADNSSDVTSLGTRVGTAETAIATLNGDEGVTGSVANSIKAAIDALPADLVVKSGEVVVNPDGKDAGTYIKLVLSSDDVIYVPADSLVDTYTGDSGYISVNGYQISFNISKLRNDLGLASEDDAFALVSDLDDYAKTSDLDDLATSASVAAAQATADSAKAIAEGNATAVSNLDALLQGDDENDGLIKNVEDLDSAINGDNGIAARLDDIETALGDTSEVTGLAAAVSANAEAINGVSAGLSGVDARLTTAEGKIAALEAVGAETNVIESVVVNGVTATVSEKVASVSIDASKVTLNAAIAESYAANASVQSVLNDLDSRISTINSSVEAALDGGVTSINAGVAVAVSTATADGASKTAPKVSVKIAENSAIAVNDSNELDLFWIEG